MKRSIFLTGFFIISFLAQSFAQLPEGYSLVGDNDKVKKMITENAEQTHSLTSDFVQEKHLTMMSEVLISRGQFFFKKSNNVHWAYNSPINYSIIINENQFAINNDGKVSTYDTETNKLFKEINNMILMAIQGNFVDDPLFESTFYQNNSFYLAQLKPQDEILKNILERIEIYFDKNGMAVKKVKFIEPEEDYTLIKFTNRKQNITINDEQFQISN